MIGDATIYQDQAEDCAQEELALHGGDIFWAEDEPIYRKLGNKQIRAIRLTHDLVTDPKRPFWWMVLEDFKQLARPIDVRNKTIRPFSL